jgi:hypothetical protein
MHSSCVFIKRTPPLTAFGFKRFIKILDIRVRDESKEKFFSEYI